MIRSNINYSELRTIHEQQFKEINGGSHFLEMPHGMLIDKITRAIHDNNWHCGEINLGVSKDKYILSASFEIMNFGTKYYKACLGVVNSNNRKRRLQFYGGVEVRVCGNGIVLYNNPIVKKHTINTDLNDIVSTALDAWSVQINSIDSRIEDLKEQRLSNEESDRILLEAGRKKLMPWSRIGQVDKDYVGGCKGWKERTAWTLVNAFSLNVKRNPPVDQMAQLMGFVSLMKEIVVPTV